MRLDSNTEGGYQQKAHLPTHLTPQSACEALDFILDLNVHPTSSKCLGESKSLVDRGVGQHKVQATTKSNPPFFAALGALSAFLRSSRRLATLRPCALPISLPSSSISDPVSAALTCPLALALAGASAPKPFTVILLGRFRPPEALSLGAGRAPCLMAALMASNLSFTPAQVPASEWLPTSSLLLARLLTAQFESMGQLSAWLLDSASCLASTLHIRESGVSN